MTTSTKGKVQIYTLEEGRRYVAPSASIPGFAYEVIMHSRPGDISCNCKGYEFRRTCKHVESVKASLPVIRECERAEIERKIRDLF